MLVTEALADRVGVDPAEDRVARTVAELQNNVGSETACRLDRGRDKSFNSRGTATTAADRRSMAPFGSFMSWTEARR